MSSFPLPPSTFQSGSPPRIAIIGGGISGLAAAHRLLELLPNAQLTLFEASSRLGGVLETVERDGFLIERSADNFLATPSAAIDLCRRLGMENDLVRTEESRRRAFIVCGGQLLPIPSGFHLMSPRNLWPVLRSPLLTIRGKLRLLAEPLILRGHETDESVASFARRRLGREVFERIVQPLVAGIYTADPETLSMAATMPQFLDFERTQSSLLFATLLNKTRRLSDSSIDVPDTATASGARYALFLAPTRGMQSLVTALANLLPPDTAHLNTRVTRIDRQVHEWNVTVNPQSAIRNPQSSFDALILALPAHAAAKVLEWVDPPLAAELAAIEYAGCAVVSFGFHRQQIAHGLDGFGFVVPQIERRRIIAASFASLKYPGRAPADDVLIRVFIGGALKPELLELPDVHLRHVALEDLTDLLHITGQPLTTDIARWPRSMPQYHVGHLDRVARIEQLASAHPMLALAGNAYHGVGIPKCIVSGRAAAQRIASSLLPK